MAAISTMHVTSHYARPKTLQWAPKPLRLAKKHPLPRLAERMSKPTLASQPVLQVQDEHHEVSALIEPETEPTTGAGDVQHESSSSAGMTSPAASSGELPALVGISPEDFLRNALPATYTFSPSTPVNNRLELSPPHRLRPSSSMSNISSLSIRSRTPSSMSIHGQLRRSSSRASPELRGAASSPSTSLLSSSQ
ncbi:hypothetical protein BDV93DRAFT_520818 [Ceratobasidium sp. AG-I]|nr:hypothetical protein BDV93DRAFT_520818 [Ceratobasidium sp. AG-I]